MYDNGYKYIGFKAPGHRIWTQEGESGRSLQTA